MVDVARGRFNSKRDDAGREARLAARSTTAVDLLKASAAPYLWGANASGAWLADAESVP